MFLGKILELLLSARIVSPCCAFTYASGARGGRISDPQIVGSSSWPGLIGGFDVVLADKGFLIKEHVSADIETKGQIDLHNAKGESYSKCHIPGHDSGGSGGSNAEQIWLFGATSFFPSLNMHKGSCVIMTFQFNELLFILITWHHLPRGAQ